MNEKGFQIFADAKRAVAHEADAIVFSSDGGDIIASTALEAQFTYVGRSVEKP